ncbi:MAG: TIR domain-containing protein [Acidimicrobiia bacterium]
MGRKCFFSFHYDQDAWRASQVRNMGKIEGNAPVSDNDWETIKAGGAPAIKKWIGDQLDGKSCAVVLIGAQTAGRKWINYEIETAWNARKGVVGIYVHNLLNAAGKQSPKGSNPFTTFTLKSGLALSQVVKAYDPPYSTSKSVYSHISDNLAAWADEAVTIRNNV